MPRIDTDSDEMETHSLGGNYSYSGTRMERLQASEYTVATVVVDTSGSTAPFVDELRDMVEAAVEALRKSPRADNLLVRVVTFNSLGIREIHGFKPLTSITEDYKPFVSEGATPLADATYTMVKATQDYGQELKQNDFSANAILFLITDGAETGSNVSNDTIRKLVADIRDKEVLESITLLLIRINASGCKKELNKFRDEVGFDGDVDAGTVTPGVLAKIAKFVASSVSSTSAALGSGGASKNIAASI